MLVTASSRVLTRSFAKDPSALTRRRTGDRDPQRPQPWGTWEQSSQVDVDLFPAGGSFPPPSGDSLFLVKRDLTNFPSGLPAGPHTFVGVSYVNGALVDTITVTIDFT